MTPQQKLRWWLVVWLSIILTAATAVHYGQALLATDSTYLSLGIVAIYGLITAWMGWAMHTGRTLPSAWARHIVGLLPSLGLIGALIGMVQLFGFNGGDVGDSKSVLSGLGLVLSATLAGLVYSEFLILQLRVCGDGD